MCHFLCCLVCLVAATNGKLNKKIASKNRKASARVIYKEFEEERQLVEAAQYDPLWHILIWARVVSAIHTGNQSHIIDYFASYRRSCIQIERKEYFIKLKVLFWCWITCNRISVISVHGRLQVATHLCESEPASCKTKEKEIIREIDFLFINSALLVWTNERWRDDFEFYIIGWRKDEDKSHHLHLILTHITEIIRKQIKVNTHSAALACVFIAER